MKENYRTVNIISTLFNKMVGLIKSGTVSKDQNEDSEMELEEEDAPNSNPKIRLLVNELDLYLKDQPYSDMELLGLFITHEREACGMSRSQLAKRAYLSLEVIMALELGVYDKDEIILEWLDRIAFVLNLNLSQLKSLISKHEDPNEDPPISDTHNDFYKEVVFATAHNQYENNDPIFYDPYHFLIDQLAMCPRDDQQVKLTQLWLQQQRQKGVYIGQSLIELALSSLPDDKRPLEPHSTPIQTEKIRIDQAAYTDPFELLIKWISYHKSYQDLIPVITYNRDLDVSIGEMLLAWSRNALEIKPKIQDRRYEKKWWQGWIGADPPTKLSRGDKAHFKKVAKKLQNLND